MKLPSPFSPNDWPTQARLIGWLALASAALVAIAAGAGVVAAILSAQGALITALVAGWILSALASPPITALVARGWPRSRAIALVWIAAAVPIVIIVAEIAIAFAQSLGNIIAGPMPSEAFIANLIARPTALLSSIGLSINLVPIASEAIVALRSLAAGLQANLGGLAAGAVSAVGPLLLAIGSGVALSANPELLDLNALGHLTPSGSKERIRHTRNVFEVIIARFIARHVALGFIYGVVVFAAATLAGADGLLAAVLGGVVMAIPSIGQGPAVVPPLLLIALSSGSYAFVGGALVIAAWLVCATQLAPRFMVGVLHLSGTTVFLAGAIGGLIAGPIGAIFALPVVAAVAAVRAHPVQPRVSRRRR